MKLSDLLAGAGAIEPVASAIPADVEVQAVAYDSRQVTQGSLFVAIRGEKADGNAYVPEAISKGATVIVSEAPRSADLAGTNETVWIQVTHARKALATIAANFYSRSADQLQLVGITGTNGKTTTAFLIDSILRTAGHGTGLFGTIEYRTPLEKRPATTTTPESLELQRFFSEIVQGGGSHAILEASSHALALDRLWGCRFAVAVFTNLTRDHLDFHKTMDEYFAAKRRLFEGTGAGRAGTGIINLDDPYGKQLNGLASETMTYGLTSSADLTTKRFTPAFSGLEFTALTPKGPIDVRSALVGRTNVYNLLAAIGASLAAGVSVEAIEKGICLLKAVPGRFETIDVGQKFLVVVDYAHTDDALRNLLTTARELHPTGRLIALFGCGGDRDRAKRPMMGEAAGRLSDVVVLSSDNPRSEDPLLIINDALVGLQRTSAKVMIEPDRERAIEMALDEARPGDMVLIAGKGHETTQVLKDRTLDFDDREVARRALKRRGYGD